MLPTPEISVILGNLQYDTHVVALQVSKMMLPGVNRARILFPVAAALDTAPGDTAQVSINAGEGQITVLTGKVERVEHRPQQTTVTVTDGAHDLSRYRPAATFEKQNAASIAEKLASDLGISVSQVTIDLTAPMYTAHQRRTAAEHIAFLASLSDGYAIINGDGELLINNWSDGPADVAIKFGRDLMDFSIARRRSLPAIAPIGNGPAGSADAPDALRPDSAQLPESIPEPGQDVIWRPQLFLRTPSAVQTAQSGLSRERNQRAAEATLVGLLRPDFEPGMTLEVQDIPAGDMSTHWVLTRVTHEFVQRSSARTLMHARESAGAVSLLDSLAGAVGGLL